MEADSLIYRCQEQERFGLNFPSVGKYLPIPILGSRARHLLHLPVWRCSGRCACSSADALDMSSESIVNEGEQ